jgi:hypothetical protein
MTMADDKRTDREIIAEAYSEEAAATWRAPVQMERGARMDIPWPIHLEAYEAYCKRYGPQTALIDLTGRGCRGGFHVGELDGFVPNWRDRATYFGRLVSRVDELEAKQKRRDAQIEAMGEALHNLSGALRASGFLDLTANHLLYEAVVKAWGPFK